METSKADPPVVHPNIDHLNTEDDTPVDNLYAEKQHKLLVEPLYASWGGPPPGGRPFFAWSDVGLFHDPNVQGVAPNMLLAVDVTEPTDLTVRENRSYFVWRIGKPPDVVVEVVSNRVGGEFDKKMARYAAIGVGIYAIWDPDELFGDQRLRCFTLKDGQYVPNGTVFADLDLSLVEWTGTYLDWPDNFLRWARADGTLLKTGIEGQEFERLRADAERDRANEEREKANAERLRADRLAAQLRAAGIEPIE